jgi:hypothetical protein
MNRRVFLGTIAASPVLSTIARASRTRERELHADIAIIGGGLGGVAAALAAARAGRRVVLSEGTDWIGGQLAQQAVPPDEHPWIESFGCTASYRRFRNGVRDYYHRHYPLTDEARARENLNPGNGSVSKLCHEPRVALAVLESMLAPFVSAGRVRILLRHRAIKATADRDRVVAVTLEPPEGAAPVEVTAPYFLDATELGDLLKLSNTEYVVGAEARKDTGELHAAAQARPANQQAFTCCFAMDHVDGEDHTLPRPDEYDRWRSYVPKLQPAWPGNLLSWQMSDPIKLQTRKVTFDPRGGAASGLNLWVYRRIIDRSQFARGAYAGDICLVNWPQNDYWLGNLIDVSAEERARHERSARQLSLSLLYWMQTEAPRADGKTGWPGLRLRPDIVGTEDGLAKHAYIRESRRIRAEFTVCEQHVGLEARRQLTGKPTDAITAEPFEDSVGIGSYRIDLHPSSGGDNYIDVSSLPFQIPLGALLPVRMENLLPACKNLGVTHITNGCYRLHPVEWNIGEAAGALASFALERKELPRQVRKKAKLLQDFQRLLQANGVELAWPKITPR